MLQGLGSMTTDAPTFSLKPGSSGHGSCSATYWNLVPWAVSDPDCYQPTMLIPKAPAPTATLTDVGYVDVAGNEVYAVNQETPQDNMTRYTNMLQDFMAGLGIDPADKPKDNGLGALLLVGFVMIVASGGGSGGKRK